MSSGALGEYLVLSLLTRNSRHLSQKAAVVSRVQSKIVIRLKSRKLLVTLAFPGLMVLSVIAFLIYAKHGWRHILSSSRKQKGWPSNRRKKTRSNVERRRKQNGFSFDSIGRRMHHSRAHLVQRIDHDDQTCKRLLQHLVFRRLARRRC
jgi:hypothetical protein